MKPRVRVIKTFMVQRIPIVNVIIIISVIKQYINMIVCEKWWVYANLNNAKKIDCRFNRIRKSHV